jgi:uncharacterized protein involved in outer membrane biogenesis
MANSQSSPKQRKRSWGRILAIVAAIFLILIVVGYFVGTSSAFIKAVVLPRAGAALNARITADDVSLSPFSQLIVRKLTIHTTGAEPLAVIDHARIRYDLGSILRGTTKVSEVTLESPVIHVRQAADGSSNLDPILQSSSKKKEPSKKSEPGQISIRNVSLKNATIRLTKTASDNSVQTIELAGVDLTVPQLENNQPCKIDFASDVMMETRVSPSGKGTNSLLQAKAAGGFQIGLDNKLTPQSVQGSARFNVSRGVGSLAELTGLVANLQTDLSPTQIKQLALRMDRNANCLISVGERSV